MCQTSLAGCWRLVDAYIGLSSESCKFQTGLRQKNQHNVLNVMKKISAEGF